MAELIEREMVEICEKYPKNGMNPEQGSWVRYRVACR